MNYCMHNAGTAVLTAGPGSRSDNPEHSLHNSLKSPDQFVKVDHLDCAFASFMNGVWIMRGIDSAKVMLDALMHSDIHIQKLGQLPPIVSGMKIRLNIRRPTNKSTTFKFPETKAFGCVIGYKFGVFLIRLISRVGVEVDHVVVYNATSKLIYD